MALAAIGLVIGLSLYLVVMTHKVAGPLYKVALYFDKMADGRLGQVWPLRKGDMLVDFYESFRAVARGAAPAAPGQQRRDRPLPGRLRYRRRRRRRQSALGQVDRGAPRATTAPARRRSPSTTSPDNSPTLTCGCARSSDVRANLDLWGTYPRSASSSSYFNSPSSSAPGALAISPRRPRNLATAPEPSQ